MMHYHVGNYYTYQAATSVCPNGTTSTESKDWKLPTSNTQTNGSFYYLLNKYGLTSAPISGNNAIYGAPLYFLAGGRVNNGSLEYAGSNGNYWSSTGYNTANAYGLGFSSSSVGPSGYSNRYLGQFVRCLVLGS